MADYKKIADIMDAHATDLPWTSEADFKELMKKRKMEFVGTIDIVNGDRREIWGNKNFQIIVRHNHEHGRYKIL